MLLNIQMIIHLFNIKEKGEKKMDTTDRRIHKSKNALKAALLSLMQHKEFKRITITEIVALADLNRGTFYKHYQYKEDLLNDVIDDVISDLIASYRAPYENNQHFFQEKLSASAVKIFDHVAEYSSFYTIIVNSEALPGFQNKICDVLKDLAINDIFLDRSDLDIDRGLSASYHAYSLLGMIVEWVKGGFKHTSHYMAEQLIKIVSINTFTNK